MGYETRSESSHERDSETTYILDEFLPEIYYSSSNENRNDGTWVTSSWPGKCYLSYKEIFNVGGSCYANTLPGTVLHTRPPLNPTRRQQKYPPRGILIPTMKVPILCTIDSSRSAESSRWNKCVQTVFPFPWLINFDSTTESDPIWSACYVDAWRGFSSSVR